MRAQEKEKIADYLAGIQEIKTRGFFPIGAILVEEKDRKKVLEMLEKDAVKVIETDAPHPDMVLESLMQTLTGGHIAALNIKGALHQKIFNQLKNFTSEVMVTELAGRKEPLTITSFPAGAKVILVMRGDYYRDFQAQDMISSVCQL